MLGFGDLRDPDADLVVTVQADAKFTQAWFQTVARHLRNGERHGAYVNLFPHVALNNDRVQPVELRERGRNYGRYAFGECVYSVCRRAH